MKLFQIEEPDGTPIGDAPGVAVGIELSATKGAAVAVAVGGNAELLPGADGGGRIALAALDEATLGAVMLELRARAEKALARPVTHAVVAAERAPAQDALAVAAAAAGLTLLGLVDAATAASLAPQGGADAAVLGAAIRAEDATPPPR
jgi:hypothetical protein